MGFSSNISERCNRPAWRFYDNGYRVCRDHAPMNDPEQHMADNPIGPCDYPLDGLADAPFVSVAAQRQAIRQSMRGLEA